MLLPLVQAAALESDVSLVEKWAALLANAADPTQRVQVQPAFAEVLRQLTPTDALVLQKLYFPAGTQPGRSPAGSIMLKQLVALPEMTKLVCQWITCCACAYAQAERLKLT